MSIFKRKTKGEHTAKAVNYSLCAVLMWAMACAPTRPPDPNPVVPPTPTDLPYWHLSLTVTDAKTEQSIAGAHVTLDPARGDQGERYTDGSGGAHVHLRQGEYRVRVEADGYQPSEQSIDQLADRVLQIALEPIVPVRLGRRGPVRISGRTLVDDDGPFLALGASLFWSIWGESNDSDRLDANLAWLADRGVDYVRILGMVGTESWADRRIDPLAPAYWPTVDALLARLARHGLRAHVTLFADAQVMMPDRADRERFVDRWAQVLNAQPERFLVAEISNEAWQNGFAGLDIFPAHTVADGHDSRQRHVKATSDSTQRQSTASLPPVRGSSYRLVNQLFYDYNFSAGQFLGSPYRPVVMRDVMSLRRHHFDILWPVVAPNGVDVMDDLARKQRTPNVFLGDKQAASDITTFVGSRMIRPKDQRVSVVPDQATFPPIRGRSGRLDTRGMSGNETFPSSAGFAGNIFAASTLTDRGRSDRRPFRFVSHENILQDNTTSGIAQLRALGRRLAAQTDVLVALSTPKPDGTDACALYAGSGADVATVHYQRDFRADGPWRPARQPWGWPLEYEATCRGQLPPAMNSEPIGPQSSVAADDDPTRLIMGALTTWLSQNSAYVLHTAAGIRGGGAADLARGRSANLWEVPGAGASLTGLQTWRSDLPPDLPNWTRHNAGWSGAPIAGFDRAIEAGALIRAYAATKDQRFVVVVLGLKRSVTVAPKRAAVVEVRDPLTAAVLTRYELATAQPFTLEGREAFVLTGEVR